MEGRGAGGRDAGSERASPLGAFAACVALGVGWLALEGVQLGVTQGAAGGGEIAHDLLRYLPVQILVFALLGAGLALLAGLRRLSTGGVVWLATGVASLLFLGARVVEGLLRAASAAQALLGAAAVAASVAALLGLLAAAGALLPHRLRPAWPPAACVGWSVAFLPFVRRTGAAFGLGELGPAGALAYLELRDLALGAAAAAAALALGAVLGGRRAGLSLVAACALAAVAALGGADLPPAPAIGSGDAARATRDVPPDVIVILIDTLRADHAPGGSASTPALDAIARQSIVFTRAYAPSNLTRRSMPGILSSLPANVTGQVLPPRVETLAELLRRAGYATYGISSNPFVSAQYGYAQGFDRLIDPSEDGRPLVTHFLKVAGWAFPGATYRAGLVSADLYYRPASAVRRRAVRIAERAARPLFLYLHTMDAHGPYLPPKAFLGADYDPGAFYSYYRFLRLAGENVLNSPAFAPRLRNLRARYAAEVRHGDAELGRLVEDLRARDRWDEALVWILSDHGEAFGERDYAGHGGRELMSTLTRVPLLLKPPRSWSMAPRVVETPVSAFDLLPTTLSLLGRPWPPEAFGADLSALLRGEPLPERPPIVSENIVGDQHAYSCVQDRWRLTVRYPLRDGAAFERDLFDLERDPGEQRDVLARHAEVAGALEAALAAHRRRERELAFDREERALDPATAEQLRNLGYFQ